MKIHTRTFATFVIGWSSIFCSVLHAELPPGAYEELLKNAQEVVELRVTKVTQTSDSNADMLRFVCTADILAVERSKAGLKKGEQISFRSYYVTEAARQRGFVGPKSPPRLQPGWTGRVYLDAGREGKNFELAAYGRSFEPLESNRASDSPPRLGVQARPAADGGLEIFGVARRSLADKLGLRSGDRVLQINGMPTTAIADVQTALSKSADHVEVNFMRDGELVELALKRR